jgi:two-component system sensor histidine kinase AlgZ
VGALLALLCGGAGLRVCVVEAGGASPVAAPRAVACDDEVVRLCGGSSASLARWLLIVVLVVAMLLAYFDLRGRALSPALAEARLQALQARIRPHFLFNSINAVLSLVRQEPRRAETALEDMAELFRALMADNRELTPLVNEIELCRQYLNLEQLRLGDRLQIEWHIDKMPRDALVPPTDVSDPRPWRFA